MPEQGVRAVFAASVRRARQARGWSREELGRRSGVSKNTLLNVELQRSGTTLDVAALLAGALGMGIGELAGDGHG
jgi:transcriptional regulator with XRE-family HTH domain